MLKLTLPTVDDFYADLVEHPKVLRVVALSGGYSRDEANALLARNHGVIASFSRALTEGLTAQQSDEEFDAGARRVDREHLRGVDHLTPVVRSGQPASSLRRARRGSRRRAPRLRKAARLPEAADSVPCIRADGWRVGFGPAPQPRMQAAAPSILRGIDSAAPVGIIGNRYVTFSASPPSDVTYKLAAP